MTNIEVFCEKCKTIANTTQLWCDKCKELNKVQPIEAYFYSNYDLSTMWSLSDFLPQFNKIMTLSEGNTPCTKISRDKPIKGLILKLEFRNPTGSFRDRAASVIVSDALNKKQKKIVGASTGSFNISLAAYSAKAGIKSTNILPLNLDLSKKEQIQLYGGEVKEVGETVEEAVEFASDYSRTTSSYLATPESNILTIEGQKTIALELVIQKKEISSIIVPKGSGTLILSIFRGYEDAIKSGWIEDIPSIYAVSLKKTHVSHFAESLESKPSKLHEEVKKILVQTKGKDIEIDASVMIDKAMKLAKNEGLFIEPASASVIAAAHQLVETEQIDVNRTVGILTGTGINALNIFASQLRGHQKAVWGLSQSSTTKFEILNFIANKKANYGIAIWNSLGKSPTKQSIYQHLNQLEKKGLISVIEPKMKQKKYKITRKGLEIIERMRALIDYV